LSKIQVRLGLWLVLKVAKSVSPDLNDSPLGILRLIPAETLPMITGKGRDGFDV
jgi:hypothetical protein